MGETPAVGGRRAAGRQDRRRRLLDSAEELFANRGYFGVSVREITDHAGTRLAAVSEEFEGKHELFRAVVLRRIRPLNEDRRQRLAVWPAGGNRAGSLRALVEAVVEPMRARAGDPGLDNYFRLIAQQANAGQPIRVLFADDFNAIGAEFIAALRTLFPDAAEAAIHDAYLHMVAAALHTYSNNLRMHSLSRGRVRGDDVDERHRALVVFVTGGIAELIGDD